MPLIKRWITVQYHVIAPLNGKEEYLGYFEERTRQSHFDSCIFYCFRCGKNRHRIFTRLARYDTVNWDSRGTVCAACGGDDTILFKGYWGSKFQDLIHTQRLPDKFLLYELEAALTFKSDVDRLTPRRIYA